MHAKGEEAQVDETDYGPALRVDDRIFHIDEVEACTIYAPKGARGARRS